MNSLRSVPQLDQEGFSATRDALKLVGRLRSLADVLRGYDKVAAISCLAAADRISSEAIDWAWSHAPAKQRDEALREIRTELSRLRGVELSLIYGLRHPSRW